MRPGVIEGELQSLGLKVAGLQAEIHSVVPAIAVRRTEVDVSVLVVGTGRLVVMDYVTAIYDGVAVVGVSTEVAVDVGNRILMDSARPRVFYGSNRIPYDLVLHRERIGVCVSGLNVGIHATQRDCGKYFCPRASKRAEIVRRKRVSSGARQRRNRVGGRVLNYVEGYVAEIALIADAIRA